ncbi:hypothetical protein V1477_012011, partial [Vespula maculifrons]
RGNNERRNVPINFLGATEVPASITDERPSSGSASTVDRKYIRFGRVLRYFAGRIGGTQILRVKPLNGVTQRWRNSTIDAREQLVESSKATRSWSVTFAWQQRKFAAARLPSSREFIKAGAGSRLIPANPPKPCSINIAATQRFSLATELRSVEAGPTWNPRKLWRVESIFGRPKPITDTPTAALGSIAVANLMPALHHCELPHGEDLLKSRRQRDGGGGGGGGEGLRASLPRAKLGLRDLGPSGHPLSAFSCSSVSADALGFQDH